MAAKKKVVKGGKKPKDATATKETGRWNGHIFQVGAQKIKSFTDLTIRASSELNSKEDSNQGFASRKGGNPTEITLSVILNAFTGCDVRGESMKFVQEAREGHVDYMYIGSKKLVWYKLLLTEATIKDIVIAHNGKWVSSVVTLTLQQSDGKTGDSNPGSSSGGSGGGGGGGGSSGGGGGGGGGYGGGAAKQSVYNTSPTTTVTAPKLTSNNVAPNYYASGSANTPSKINTVNTANRNSGTPQMSYLKRHAKQTSAKTPGVGATLMGSHRSVDVSQ